MEPDAPRPFPPAQAGALLGSVTAAFVGGGALAGWALGSTPYGLIVGAVVGIPAGVGAVYVRYHGYFE